MAENEIEPNVKFSFEPEFKCQTASIPEAGRVLGVGRNASYEAAKNGEIKYIQIGKKKRVSLAWLQDKLAGEG